MSATYRPHPPSRQWRILLRANALLAERRVQRLLAQADGLRRHLDQFVVVEDASQAREIAQRRERLDREAKSRRTTKGVVSLEDFMSQAAAGLKLQRGTILLRIGRWDDAERAFAGGDALFPGYWQIEQNRAQMAALRGDINGAIRLYRTAIAHGGAPETMDALAALYRAQGDHAQADALSRQAAHLWDARLKAFPEAAQAHALDHYLAFGPTARTLRLALAGFHARPHGASAIALGWALLANRRADDALRIAQAVSQSGWVPPHRTG